MLLQSIFEVSSIVANTLMLSVLTNVYCDAGVNRQKVRSLCIKNPGILAKKITFLISFPQEASSHRVDGSIVQYGWFCVGLHHSTPPNSIWARRYTSSKTDGRVRSQNPPGVERKWRPARKRWLWGKTLLSFYLRGPKASKSCSVDRKFDKLLREQNLEKTFW